VRDGLAQGAAGEAAAPQACAAGQCAADCPLGQAVCSGVCVDLAADPVNCGGCAKACKAPPHGTPICKSVCRVLCDAGFKLCGNECVDTSQDKKHCGSCEKACSKGACVAGVCDDDKDD
jgi:hypothetical protein